MNERLVFLALALITLISCAQFSCAAAGSHKLSLAPFSSREWIVVDSVSFLQNTGAQPPLFQLQYVASCLPVFARAAFFRVAGAFPNGRHCALMGALEASQWSQWAFVSCNVDAHSGVRVRVCARVYVQVWGCMAGSLATLQQCPAVKAGSTALAPAVTTQQLRCVCADPSRAWVAVVLTSHLARIASRHLLLHLPQCLQAQAQAPPPPQVRVMF